jgi:hypothetical protein
MISVSAQVLLQTNFSRFKFVREPSTGLGSYLTQVITIYRHAKAQRICQNHFPFRSVVKYIRMNK